MTADTLFEACKAGRTDDGLVQKAICFNIADDVKRQTCLEQVRLDRTDAKQSCSDLHEGRLAACTLLGEAPYDPNFDPALFDDPKNPSHPNPYFPMAVHDKWEYQGNGEVNTVEVLDDTKLIAGVTCAVFDDEVFTSGNLTEKTNDWFCQQKSGDVNYFGEETAVFETFPGDMPPLPELVSIEGSFKQGRGGDKGGLIFPATPTVGFSFLEEFSLDNAEDVTTILSTTYKFGSDPTLDQAVPQALAETYCSAGDCVVTKNFSLLEPPDVFARKYYAKGVGVILEVEIDPEEPAPVISELTACNFDPRCPPIP